jgi:hypothetical protein
VHGTGSERSLFYVQFKWFPAKLREITYECALKILGLTMKKKRIYNFKIILFLNIISLKTNTFFPGMLQRHYPVPVVILVRSAKNLSTAAIASWFEDTFIPGMLQRHYPVPVVILVRSAKNLSTAAIASWL